MPSKSKRHHLTAGVMQGSGTLLCCVAMLVFWARLDDLGDLALAVGTVLTLFLVSLLGGLIYTAFSWRRERKIYNHMLQADYPKGLERGKELLASRVLPMKLQEDINDGMHAVYMMLVEEGYSVNFILIVTSLYEFDRIAVIESQGCVLTHDGGRTTDLFYEKSRKVGKAAIGMGGTHVRFNYVDPQDRRWSWVERSAQGLLRLRAYVQGEAMARETVQTNLAPVRVARL